MSTEKLIIELDAKTAALDAKLAKTDAKLDLLAKTTKKSEARFAALSNAGRLAGKGITAAAAAGTAAAAALTAATVAAINYSKELTVAARRSGENVERMQSLAFATKTVGISMEKLGDIGKDTNEKVGEFLADGTGGFLDFVSVAKLTDEEANKMAASFKHMSGSEVLQAMVTRMEEAGAETKEMSFALEGMASDTTDLIPLLANGGKELGRLEKDFNDLNITLTKTDIKKITTLGEETAKLGLSVQNSSAKAVSVLSGEITQVTQMLANTTQDVGGLVIKAITGYQAIITSATSGLMNMFRESEILAMEAKSFIVGVFGDNSDIEAELKKLKESDALRDVFDATYLAEQWDKAKLKVADYYGEIKTQEEDAPEITTPISNSDGEGSSGRINEKDQARLDVIKDRFKEETQLLFEKYEEDKAILDLTVSDDAERKELQLQLTEEYQTKLANIKSKADKETIKTATDVAKSEVALKRQSSNAIVSIISSMVGQSDSAGKALFLLSKGLAFSEAFVNTQAASVKALTIDPTGILSAKVQTAGNISMAAIAAAALGAGGGGSSKGVSGGISPSEPPKEQQPIDNFNDQGTTITDVSGGERSMQRLIIEFNDEVVDAISRQIQKSQSDGRT